MASSVTCGFNFNLLWKLISCLIWLVHFLWSYLWLRASAADWWSDNNETVEENKPLVLGHTMNRGAWTNQRNCLCVNHRANAWNVERFSPFILPGFTAESPWPSGSERELSCTEMFFSGSSTKANKTKSRHSIIGRIVFSKVKLGNASSSSSLQTQSSSFLQLSLLSRHLVRHIFTGPPAKRYLFFIAVWESSSHTGKEVMPLMKAKLN